MAQLRTYLALLLVLIVAACLPSQEPPNNPNEPSSRTPTTGDPLQTMAGTPQLAILHSLIVDSERGRLYTVAQVNGQPKLVMLDARTGGLLHAWDSPGQLALDAARDRLVVDRGLHGISLLNSTTGEMIGTVTLPVQDNPPAPQINGKSGLIYAYRESTIHIIDPAIRGVVRTVPVSVNRVVCDTPSGDSPIYETLFDSQTNRLYLTFISYTCTPWASATIVAIDASAMVEIGRTEVDINHQVIPYNKNLYGTSVSRLGPTLYWAWDGKSLWYEESEDFEGAPAGIVVDNGRKLIYEAIGETIHIIDPKERSTVGDRKVELLSWSRLAGYDPKEDLLYFVTNSGRLYLWPGTNLFKDGPPPAAAPSPLPTWPVLSVAMSPKSSLGYTTAALLEQADCPSDGGRLYLMTAHGGWYSGDIAPESNCEAVAAVTFSPNYAQDSLILAAINAPPTVARSIDTGRSWKMAETTFPEGTLFRTLLVSPGYANDQTLYSLTSTGIVYRSRDGGRGWQMLSQRLDRIAIASDSDSKVTLFGVKDTRVLLSKDSGETWTEAGPTPNDERLTLLAAAPANEHPVLYAFAESGRFARSIDGGATWNPVMELAPAPVSLAIATDISAEQRPVFLLQNQTIFTSYDGMGSIWTARTVEEASRFRPTALAVPPDFSSTPYLFAGSVDGQIISVRADAQP